MSYFYGNNYIFLKCYINYEFINTKLVHIKLVILEMQKFQVAYLGLNNLFGKITALLLKQSPFIKCLKLYDDSNISPAIDVSAINTNCKVKAFLGREQLNNALRDVDIVIIGDEGNEKTSKQEVLFPTVADKIVSYGNAICRAAPGALVILAASPLNFLLPLLTKVFAINGNDANNKIFGSTAVDTICANSILANHLKIDPKFVTVPVIGGSSEATRVPILSLAKPNCSLSADVQREILKNIKRRDLNIFEAKGIRDSIDKAYGNVKFLSSVFAGLRGEPNIVDFAMTKTDNNNGMEYFSLPVVLGRNGITKRYGIPRLNEIEEIMLAKAATVLKKESNKACLYLKGKYLELEPSVIKRYEKLLQPNVSGDSGKNTSTNKVSMAASLEEKENIWSDIFEISMKPPQKKKYKKSSHSNSDINISYEIYSPNDQVLNLLIPNKVQQNEYSFATKNLLNSNDKKNRLQTSKLKPSIQVSIDTNENEEDKNLHNDLNKNIPLKNALPNHENSIFLNKADFNTYNKSNRKSGNLKKRIWYTEPSDTCYLRNPEDALNELEISIDMKFPEEQASQKLIGTGMKKRNATSKKKLKEEVVPKTNQDFKFKINKYSAVEKPYFSLKNNFSATLNVARSKPRSVFLPLPISSSNLPVIGNDINSQPQTYLERFKQRNMLERETFKTEVDAKEKAVGNQQTSEISKRSLKKSYSVKPFRNILKSNIVEGTLSNDIKIKRVRDCKKLNQLATNGNKIENVQEIVNNSKEQSSKTSEKTSVSNNQDVNKICKGKEDDFAHKQFDIKETETTLDQSDLQTIIKDGATLIPDMNAKHGATLTPDITKKHGATLISDITKKHGTTVIPDINKKHGTTLIPEITKVLLTEKVERETKAETANTETEEKLSITIPAGVSNEPQNNLMLNENSSRDKTVKVESQLQEVQSLNDPQLEIHASNTLNSPPKTNICNKEGSTSNLPPLADTSINPCDKSDSSQPFTQLKEKNISDQQKLKKGQYNGLKRIDFLFNPNKIKNSTKAPHKKKVNKLSLLNTKLASTENIITAEKNEISDEKLLKPAEKDLQEKDSKLRSLNKLSLLNITGQYGKFVIDNKLNEPSPAVTSSSNFTLNNPDKQNYTSNTLDQKSNNKELSKTHTNNKNFSLMNSTRTNLSSETTSLDISNSNDSPRKQYLKEKEKSSSTNNFEKESYYAQSLGTFSYADVTSLKKSVNARAKYKNVNERKPVSAKTKGSNNLAKQVETLHSAKKEIAETIKGLKATTAKSKMKEAVLKPSSETATVEAKPDQQDLFKNEETLQSATKEIEGKNDALKPATKVDKKSQSKMSLLKPTAVTSSKPKPIGHPLLKHNPYKLLSYPVLKNFKKPPLFKNKFYLLNANKQNQSNFVKRYKPTKKMEKTKVEKVENDNSDPSKTVALDPIPAGMFSKLTSYSDAVSKTQKNLEFIPSAEEILSDSQHLRLSPYKILIEKSSKVLNNFEIEHNNETISRNNKNNNWVLDTAAINYYKKRETPNEFPLSREDYPAPSLYQNIALRKASLKKIIEMKKTASKVGTSIQYRKSLKKGKTNYLVEPKGNKKLITHTYQLGRKEEILPRIISNNKSSNTKCNKGLINNSLLSGDGTLPKEVNLLKKHESHKCNNINSPFKNQVLYLEDSQQKVPTVRSTNNFVFDNVPYNEYDKYNNFPSFQHFMK